MAGIFWRLLHSLSGNWAGMTPGLVIWSVILDEKILQWCRKCHYYTCKQLLLSKEIQQY